MGYGTETLFKTQRCLYSFKDDLQLYSPIYYHFAYAFLQNKILIK